MGRGEAMKRSYMLPEEVAMELNISKEHAYKLIRQMNRELKERPLVHKGHMIKAHVLPYFKERKSNEITPASIIKWQNKIRAKGYKPIYL